MPLQMFTIGHMLGLAKVVSSTIAKVVRSTIAKLRFPGVVMVP
jgi:hypothetical protein